MSVIQMIRERSSVVAALLAGACVCWAQPASQPVPQLRNVVFTQRLNAQVPLDLKFRDETGKEVLLRDYFGKKPVILTLNYYRCPMLCNMTLTGLERALRALPFTAGNEFNIVTVSIDPRETPDLAAAKKASYIAGYNRPGAEKGWHFLTGKQNEILRLANAVGFGFEYDASKDQFAHASGIMVITPSGRVSKYFYGIEFSARDLRWGLVDASAGKIGSKVDQLLMYCFHYDPQTGKYSTTVMALIRIGGLLTICGLVALVGGLLLRERRRERRMSLRTT